jgi:hypothetical protein
MTNALKTMAGDSVQSSEFWLLPPVLGLIVEGGLDHAQIAAVAACYVAFVLARGMAKRAAPLMLAAVLLTSCTALGAWWDAPVGPQTPPDAPIVVDTGAGTVTVTPPPPDPVVTNGDAVADGIGGVVAGLTGVGALGLIAAKLIKSAGAKRSAAAQRVQA